MQRAIGLDDEDFAERLAEMAMQDDPNDLDWVPAKWRSKQTAKKKGKTYLVLSLDHGLIITERPKMYSKGPDVMSKSLRSRQRYATSFKGQTRPAAPVAGVAEA